MEYLEPIVKVFTIEIRLGFHFSDLKLLNSQLCRYSESDECFHDNNRV